MAKFIRRTWESRLAGIDVPRHDRMSCTYEAYVPDLLCGRTFALEDSVAADVADAERAIIILNEKAKAMVDTEALARLLLRAESVASSRIEGLEIGARRLLEADIAMEAGHTAQDVTAVEVLGNIKAMALALDAAADGEELSVEQLIAAHRELLRGSQLASCAGVVRTEQNWIGGNRYNPCSAAFVPPPPEYIAELLRDLCAFCSTDGLPTLVQAAIAHAQFETIHPFIDGNGRIGRILIQMILKRRGLASRVTPPVSLVLATRAEDYISALQATRYRGAASSKEARVGINRWIAEFAVACRRAVADVRQLEASIDQLVQDWHARLGHLRVDATALQLLKSLPGMPIITVGTAANLCGRSFTVVNDAMAQLVAAGILVERNKNRRNRVFEAHEIIQAFTALERRLASPVGDTRIEKPVRRVPRRKS